MLNDFLDYALSDAPNIPTFIVFSSHNLYLIILELYNPLMICNYSLFLPINEYSSSLISDSVVSWLGARKISKKIDKREGKFGLVKFETNSG